MGRTQDARGPGHSGGRRPNSLREPRVRAPVFSLLLLSALAACTGPGLEPPGSDDDRGNLGGGTVGGASGGAGGTGSGSAGIGGSAGAFGNAGEGGVVAGAGAGGVGVIGGTAGTGGTGSPVVEADAGVVTDTGDGGVEPTAPESECETGRDVVELSDGADAGTEAACEIVLPDAARAEAEAMLTVALSTHSATQAPPRVLSVLGCLLQGGSGFYYQLDALGEPERIVLCDSTCADAQAGATIELLYGCPTPLP